MKSAALISAALFRRPGIGAGDAAMPPDPLMQNLMPVPVARVSKHSPGSRP